MKSYKEILPQIKVFIFDIDGVLTDGSVFIGETHIHRILNSRDGYALQYAAKQDFLTFIISGGTSEPVKKRLLDLGVTEVLMSSKDKITSYNTLKEKYNFTDEDVLYMGDDIPDYPVMEKVALPCCPQDAAVEIKAISRYQSPYFGGRHCVRDVIEQTLRVQGKWFNKNAFEW